jgi:YidC/Oxa1 family membrane protein insertase
MATLFHLFIYQPIYNVIVFLYAILPWKDFGVAIILTTILLKLALYPLSQKQIEAQRTMQTIQPKIKKLQKKHKNDREALAKATMELYKEEKINPAAGCLPLIVQLVFLLAIYQVLINIAQAQFVIVGSDLYSFVVNPGNVQHFFLTFIDLAHPAIPLTLLAALALYYQAKMMMPASNASQSVTDKSDTANGEPDFAAIMTKQMLYIGPLLTLIIGASLPSGLSLYWLTATLITIYQQKQKSHTLTPTSMPASSL